MPTLRLSVLLALLMSLALGAGACADAPPAAPAGDPCGGIRVGDGDICVYLGAINETGFLCPLELPFAYFGDGWAMCADEAGLAAAELEAALDDADLDGEPTDPPCVDDDRDGVCVADDPDDANPTVGPTTCAEDGDADGSCAGMDFDDADAAVRDVGIHARGAGWDLVGCEASPVEWSEIAAGGGHVGLVLDTDACQGVDICLLDPSGWGDAAAPPAWVALAAETCPEPGAGYLAGVHQIADMVAVCDAAATLCWWSVVPCRDDGGQVTTCPDVEAPCRDDNRDGVCDP